MALTFRKESKTCIVDTVSGISVVQQKNVDDVSSCTNDLNYTVQNWQLSACKCTDTDWTLINKGDITSIRDISIYLTSSAQTPGLDILITNCADPNAGSGMPKTFTMREMFSATTCMDADQNIYMRNPASCEACFVVMFGGDDVVE